LRRLSEQVEVQRKVSAILPVDVLDIQQAQVRLVHQCRGLKGVAGPFPTQTPPGHTLQLLMHQRREPGQRRLVALSPGEQECRDAA
jgi:hypothetical protein